MANLKSDPVPLSSRGSAGPSAGPSSADPGHGNPNPPESSDGNNAADEGGNDGNMTFQNVEADQSQFDFNNGYFRPPERNAVKHQQLAGQELRLLCELSTYWT